MAKVDESKQMEIISELTKKAVQEYDGLQEEHERTKMECRRLQEERDGAVKKLKEFQRVSHMVIQEVNIIQENLEVEKSCRQTAEAMASKLNRQNKSLKRKSMLYLSHLGPDVLAEISLEDEDEADQEESQNGACNSSAHCQQIISELRDKLASSLDEKRQLGMELEEARERLQGTREELVKEKHDNTVLIAETVQQKKLLAKYNRVSFLALDEYEELKERLDLETDLRNEAEKFAREMLVEQKKLNRQSQILLQNTSPGETLQAALLEVSRLTQALESQKLEHLKQVKELQEQLQSCELRKTVQTLQRQAELLEEERREYEERCSKAEIQAKDLRFTVEELQKRLQQAVNAPPAPAPTPTAPPPPAPTPSPAIRGLQPSQVRSPLRISLWGLIRDLHSSLLSMIRKKRQVSNDIPLVIQDSPVKDAGREVIDVRQQAVEEMMQRIKKGVQLRPVSSTSRSRQPQKEKVAPDSAIQELKGILDTFRRPPPGQYKAGVPMATAETELERVLGRRRCAVETTADDRDAGSETPPNPLPSSALDMNPAKRAEPPTQTPQEPCLTDSHPLTPAPASKCADSGGNSSETVTEP
ncbi:hypothetical protein GJAV_G00242810 [Gymnothorax javanicus]|nr:hypothetical protein GJAV_G00242810 [Gymnothorax javanicus]